MRLCLFRRINFKEDFPMKILISFYQKSFIHNVKWYNWVVNNWEYGSIISKKSWFYIRNYLVSHWYKLKLSKGLGKKFRGHLLLQFSIRKTDYQVKLFVFRKIRIPIMYPHCRKVYISVYYVILSQRHLRCQEKSCCNLNTLIEGRISLHFIKWECKELYSSSRLGGEILPLHSKF